MSTTAAITTRITAAALLLLLVLLLQLLLQLLLLLLLPLLMPTLPPAPHPPPPSRHHPSPSTLTPVPPSFRNVERPTKVHSLSVADIQGAAGVPSRLYGPRRQCDAEVIVGNRWWWRRGRGGRSGGEGKVVIQTRAVVDCIYHRGCFCYRSGSSVGMR